MGWRCGVVSLMARVLVDDEGAEGSGAWGLEDG